MAFARLKNYLLGKAPPALFDLVNKVHQATDHTPDILWLQRKAYQPVFIYDELMKGFPRNYLLENSTYIGKAFTDRTNFTLWKKKLGLKTFPIPVKSENGGGCRILGELYFVPTADMIPLDKYKLNGVLFSRQRTPVNFPYRVVRDGKLSEERNHEVDAWMYVGKRTFWQEHFDGGYNFGKCEVFEPKYPWSENYYLFTKEDLKP